MRRLWAWMTVAGVLLASAAALAAPAPPAMPFSGPAVDTERLAVNYVSGALRILDDVVLANPHDQALSEVSLPLAAGARQVQLMQGATSARPVGDTLVVPVAIPAHGHAEISFSYELAAAALPTSVSRAVTMPTAGLAVIVRDGALAIRSGQLTDAGSGAAQGVPIRQYVVEGLPPGQTLSFTVAYPPTALETFVGFFTPRIWMYAAALALAALVAVGLRREARGA